MSLYEIVGALKGLWEAQERAGLPIANQFLVLNHWQ